MEKAAFIAIHLEGHMLIFKNYLFKEDKRRGRRRSIISNIAFVFAATDFWDDNIENPNRVRRYSDRIKKRLKDFSE